MFSAPLTRLYSVTSSSVGVLSSRLIELLFKFNPNNSDTVVKSTNNINIEIFIFHEELWNENKKLFFFFIEKNNNIIKKKNYNFKGEKKKEIKDWANNGWIKFKKKKFFYYIQTFETKKINWWVKYAYGVSALLSIGKNNIKTTF